MTQMGGRVSNVEGQVQKMSSQIAELDSRLKQTDAKAERALENLQRLKLDRRLVLDFKQGAFFASNSTVLTDQAKKEIDSFLSDLRGDADGMGNVLLVVAGHTDNTGTVKYNYELAKIRAENAAGCRGDLLRRSGCDDVSAVADNATEAGRVKNRRVEILVYRDTIIVGSAGQVAPGGQQQSTVR